MSDQTFPSDLEELAARFIINLPEIEPGKEILVFDLLIHFESAYWHYQDFFQDKYATKKKLNFKQFICEMCDIIPILKPHKKVIVEQINRFQRLKKTIPVAGVVCFNADKSKVITVRDTSNSQVLGFPKGKISEGESLAVAAVRETIEEIGIDVSPYFKENQYKVFKFKKKYHFFYVIGVPEDLEMITIHRNEVSKVEWIKVSELRSEKNKSKVMCHMLDWVEEISRSPN